MENVRNKLPYRRNDCPAGQMQTTKDADAALPGKSGTSTGAKNDKAIKLGAPTRTNSSSERASTDQDHRRTDEHTTECKKNGDASTTARPDALPHAVKSNVGNNRPQISMATRINLLEHIGRLFANRTIVQMRPGHPPETSHVLPWIAMNCYALAASLALVSSPDVSRDINCH